MFIKGCFGFDISYQGTIFFDCLSSDEIVAIQQSECN